MKLTIISILLFATVAHADNKEKAEALFKQGKKLMEQKRFADACAAFEKSNKLDPGIGAQLNTAKCYQEWGKIGRAYLAYQAAEKAAQEANPNDKRIPQIHEYVVALEPEVPHLTIKLPKEFKAETVKVTLDGDPVTSFDTPIVVDPGPHMIEWYVSGSGRKQNQVVAVERGGKQEFTLEVQKSKTEGGGVVGGGGEPKKPDEDEQPTSTTGRNQRIAGIAVGAGGVVAITISTIMTVSAKGKYSDALTMYCGGETDGCDAMGLTLTHEARTTANQATVVFLLGAAMVGGGVALYLLAPKPAPAPAEEREARSRRRSPSRYIVPAISPDGIGVVFGGHL